VELHGARFDTMLESYVWNSTATRHDIEPLARRYLGMETITYESITGKGAKQIGFNQAPIDAASTYAAQTADIALQLHDSLWPRVTAERALQSLYEQIEQPLVGVLVRMEQTGVLIDGALLKQQ